MKSKKKIIVIIAAAIIVIGGLIGTYIVFSEGNLFSGYGNDIETKLINEDTGEYMAIGVSKNYVFSIETGDGADGVQVHDIEGNPAGAFCEQTDGGVDIRPPENGYEKGGIYRIELAEGCSFKDEKLKKAKSLLFVVNKNNTINVDYTDKVKTPDSGSIEKTGNSLLLDGEYVSGDIVAADTDNDGVDELYKLENTEFNGEQTSAEYVEPDADEVYENIDIFMYDYVDFEETDIDTDAFEGALEETGILDAFIGPVYAAGNTGIKITSKKGDNNEYLFTAVITDPKNKKRQLTIKFGVKDKFLILSNGKLVMADNTVEITSGLEFSVSGESSAETEQKILDAIEEYTLNNEEIGDENSYEVPLVPIRIPVAGPVVADIDIGLTADILFSAKFSAGMDTKVSLTQGVAVNIKQRKIVEKYAEVTGSTEAYICVEGKLDAFAGVYADLGLEISVLVKLGVNIKGGPYLEGKGCFSVKGIPKDIKAEGKCDIEIGLRFKAEGDLKILNLKKKPIKFADKQKILAEYSKNYKRKNIADSSNNTDIMNSNIGDTVTFGNYGGNPIEWVVLDKIDSKVMLFAKYNFMEERAYNTGQNHVPWETSDLRLWLNNEFLNEAFSESEISAIADTNVNNFEETDGYMNDTVDKVYLLSHADFKKYRDILYKYDAVYEVDWWEEPYVRKGIGTFIWLRDSYDYGPDMGIYHSFINHYGECDSRAITQDGSMNIRPVIWLESLN